MNELEQGAKVRDNYGRVHTVLRQAGTSVYTYEDCTNTIHRTKCFPVYWSNGLGWVPE